MEEGGVKIIALADLLRRSRPVTAASSLTPSRSISPSSKPQPSDRNQTSTPPTQNPNPHPKTLSSLNHPSLIIGTLTLPSHDNNPSSSNSTPRCSKTSCFSFSDGSSVVCCDILDLDVRIIGRKIHVLAWNFIPLKCGGGFLEIITWRLPETSGVIPPCSNVFPLVSDSVIDCGDGDKAKYLVRGELESVSPVSVVPCVSNSSVSRNVCGFLVQILVCKCKLCCVKDSKLMAMQDQIEGQDSHCFAKPVIVYFCGSASSWHPVIIKLIGSVVLLSGLKKKLVFIGEEDSQLMYVTSEKTLLHLPKVINRRFPASKTVIKGKGECGMYTGTVTGIYMQSMVVELDREVMLLTDRLIALPHSLRVGAIVSMRNVHFVNPKFCWTKVLILGACYRTSIIVKSFSPFETGCCLSSQSQSLLGKFINSLSFSVKLWVLLLVSSFRKKFAGILNEKEILGSNNSKGVTRRKDWFSHMLLHSYLHLCFDLGSMEYLENTVSMTLAAVPTNQTTVNLNWWYLSLILSVIVKQHG
ncbi:CST complex subunit CTC1-like isoform X1 [Rhododendron vialii]|uniref:CST complex subunit CTC1-like isoform X1 n=1 Tax=Rhododendron vialii TaxID=182163 RepID=UPI00265FC644|nr:CST complex subunit CTC1-like isoform X1 [Rhododendron vialii]